MNRKNMTRAIMMMVLGLAMAVMFLPALGQVDNASAKEVTGLEIKSTEGFTLPADDPSSDIDYLTCHLYEDGEGDVLIVSYDDGTSVKFYCTDDESWEFTSEGENGQTITLGVYGWKDNNNEFKVGQSYDAYVVVVDTGGVEGVKQYQELKPQVPVMIVDSEPSVFIKNITVTLDSGKSLQLTETENGYYDENSIVFHEGDKCVVDYSDETQDTFVADEDGIFYNDDFESVDVYFNWVKAEGVEFDDDGRLSGKSGESYDAYAFTYKKTSVHTTGEEVFAKDENNEFAKFPVTIVGYEWDIDYDWAEDYSSVTATAVRKDDPSITKTETVNTTSEITKYPNDTEMGVTTYTAKFTNTLFTTQTKPVANIPLRDFIITGGEEGTDFTYTDGVLTFLKNGAYSVRMRTGVTETSDRIVIDAKGTPTPGTGVPVDPAFSSINLTLDGVTVTTTGAGAHGLFMDTRYRETPFNCNLVLKGKNTFTSDKSPWFSGNSHLWNLTVDADSGTNDDTLELTDAGDGQFDLYNFTLNSGKFKLASGEFNANKVVTIVDGEFVVDSSDAAGSVYCNDAFIMKGGKVEVTCTGSRCIHVAGTQTEAGDGVVITGGELTLTSNGTSGAATITAGDRQQKNIVIDTTGTVTINTKYYGISTFNGGNVTMKNGSLKINGGEAGIALDSRSGKLFVEGGETEIQSTNALRLNNEDKKVNFGEDYVHKNYAGQTAEDRTPIGDSEILPVSVGSVKIAQPYLLIIPAEPITYDLDGGILEEGAANPDVYTKIDTITLKNPTKEGYDFLGWTGTDLTEPTQTVMIPEGSTGARSYKANFGQATFKYVAGTGGTVSPKSETVKAVTGEPAGSTATPSSNYEFVSWTDEDGTTVSTSPVFKPEKKDGKYVSATYVANFQKQGTPTPPSPDVVLQYAAGTGGTVSPKSETITATGTAAGSTAKANADYEFVCWTDSEGVTVSQSATFVPEKKDGRYTSAVYVANFRKSGGGQGGNEIALILPAPDMTYNGQPQTAYSDARGYTVENGTATDAGTYKAVFTPKDGFVWADGTTDSKEVTYIITKATLTAKYVGETIEWYKKPAMKVKVTGFVNGETAKTAKDYKAPKAKAPKYKPHKTYKVKPSGGSSANYKFKYVSGKLTVKCKTAIIATAKAGKSKANLSWTKVPGATGYKIYGSKCGKPYKLLKKIKGQKTLKTTIKKLQTKSYKFYVVAYRAQGGKTITLSKSPSAHVIINNAVKGHSNPTGIKVNKTSVTVKKGKSVKVKGTIVCKKKPLNKAHGAYVRYKSSDIHFAKVDKNGKITGKKKGKCKVYVYTQNGIWKAVKVTVK